MFKITWDVENSIDSRFSKMCWDAFFINSCMNIMPNTIYISISRLETKMYTIINNISDITTNQMTT